MRRVLSGLMVAAALFAAAVDSQSARRKLDVISQGRAAAAAHIVLTPGEVNAWIRDEANARVPEGARNPRVELGINRATGYADVDFLKLRQAAGAQGWGTGPGWLLKKLLAGERPVKVTATFQSRNGRGRVDVERVEISGIAIEGPALDFLIGNFVLPMFPYATVSQWFELQFGVDRFRVSPAGIFIVMRR